MCSDSYFLPAVNHHIIKVCIAACMTIHSVLIPPHIKDCTRSQSNNPSQTIFPLDKPESNAAISTESDSSSVGDDESKDESIEDDKSHNQQTQDVSIASFPGPPS